jgi:hypothetical protein
LIVWPGGRKLASVGLNLNLFGTRSPRRTKATVIYRRTTLSRALFKANAAHNNFEINTDYLSWEGYIADSIRTITTFYCAIACQSALDAVTRGASFHGEASLLTARELT